MCLYISYCGYHLTRGTLLFGKMDAEPFAGRKVADSLPRANILLKVPLAVLFPFR